MVESRIPFWIDRIQDIMSKQNIINILKTCKNVVSLKRRAIDESLSDAADIEGAMQDLEEELRNISKKAQDLQNNPLWQAVMQIRPQVIGGVLPVAYTQILSEALWAIKNEFTEAGDEEKANFFGRLASRLNSRDVNFFRAVITGGSIAVFVEKSSGNKHYFPGIPRNIRKECGVKLSTHPDNIESIRAGYMLMIEETDGYARKALEANLEDLTQLFKSMQQARNR